MNWVSFPGIGVGRLYFNDYVFRIFGLTVNYYALIFSLAIVSGITLAYYLSPKVGVLRTKTLDIGLVGLIFGIIGARIYYVVFNPSQFFKQDSFIGNLLEILNLRLGGIAIYGGLIFSILSGLVFCKISKVKIFPMLDLTGISFLLGQAIGRWGNFFNVEAYGRKTDLPWGMCSSRIEQHLQPVHPTFFYESVWCFLGFIFLILFFKYRKFDGELFFIYLIWYGFERFFVEGLRTDSLMLFQTQVRVSQLLSAILFIFGAICLFYFHYRTKKYGIKLYVKTKTGLNSSKI